MATSGTIQAAIRTGYRIQIAWNVTSQSVANNTSTVTAKVQLVSTGSSYTINSTASKSGSLTINGTKYSFNFTAALSGNQTKTLYEKSVTITHNADGSKTCAFACSAGINVTLSGTYYGTVTASGNGTFDTIPRATTPTVSASSVDMGASITISMPRAASSFTHTLTYKLGSATGTIGSGLGTSTAWTVPLSLASQIPSATSATCTITCKTYSGSTLIGTKTVNFTAKVPASVVPTISSVAVADTTTNLSTFGNMVQGKSIAKYTIAAAGAYGSTISAYKTVFEGKTYTGATPTTAVITGSGTRTATITITDSRGRTASTTKSFTAVAYSVPKITILTAVRVNADGVDYYEGQHANIAVAFSVAAVNNKNANAYKLEYRKKGDTAWTSLLTGNSYSYSQTTLTGAVFSLDSAYEVKLTVTDSFGSVTKTTELPTAFTLLDFNASGRALAFGKVSELTEGIEFALPLQSKNGEFANSPFVLSSGDDLNTKLKAGYYVFSSAVSTTLLNSPLGGSGSGSLEIIREGESTQLRQVITRCSEAYREVWERLYYSNSWKAWLPVYKGNGRILWTGGMYMTETHKIPLSEPVSQQPNGIVLVFSRYANGAVADTNFNHFFVHKALVAEKTGNGSMFVMYATPTFEYVGGKYLYINDTNIAGHASNSATGTSATTGITYANNAFVLRYVIGV